MTDMTMEQFAVNGPGTFGFSAVVPGDLPEDEYTIVAIVNDVSPSTEDLRDEICKMEKNIVKACRKDPTLVEEKLLIRRSIFGSRVEEAHGYKPLSMIDEDNDYQPEKTIGGSTALYDATYDAVGSVLDYAKLLDDQADIMSNGIVFVITDGMDNVSSMSPSSIVDKVKSGKIGEIIESLKIILIGINDPNSGYSRQVTQALSEFQANANIDQFIDAGDATPQKIAKVGGFVSKSISSQSQSLHTGGQSQNLTF